MDAPAAGPDRRLIIDWTATFLLATAAACVVGLVSFMPMISRMLALEAFPSTAVIVFGAAAMGMLHGALVGAGEARVLRRRLHRPVPHWALATGAGAAIAWTGCLLINIRGVADGLSDRRWHQLVVVGGLAFGGMIGTTQWLVLRRALPHVAVWIPVNAIAWLLGSLVIVFGMPLAERTDPALAGSAIVVATGVFASLVAGLVPAIALAGLAARADRAAGARGGHGPRA